MRLGMRNGEGGYLWWTEETWHAGWYEDGHEDMAVLELRFGGHRM